MRFTVDSIVLRTELHQRFTVSMPPEHGGERHLKHDAARCGIDVKHGTSLDRR